VRVAPGLARGEIVADRIPARKQAELKPTTPIRNVRNRNKEDTARTKHAPCLRGGSLRLEEVFEYMATDHGVELGVPKRQSAYVVNSARVETSRARFVDRGLRDVYADVPRRVFGQPETRRSPVSASEVKASGGRRHVRFE
jgi:hypothetical protein